MPTHTAWGGLEQPGMPETHMAWLLPAAHAIRGVPAVHAVRRVPSLHAVRGVPAVHAIRGVPSFQSAPVFQTIQAAPAVTAVRTIEEDNFDPSPNYNFGYSITDSVTGDSKSRQESRDGDVVSGS